MSNIPDPAAIAAAIVAAAQAAAAAAAANAAALAQYVPDPSYNPDAPVVATYSANSNILYTDPTTGALVFPTDIQTASGSALLTKTDAKNTYLAISDTPTVSISTPDLGHNITISKSFNNYTLHYDNLLNFLYTLASIDSPTFTGTVSGITAAMVGLGNVNNTSDADKPISNATQLSLIHI